MSASSDLAVAKSAPAASVTSGDPLTYTITVTNDGPSGDGHHAEYTLPVGMTLTSATPAQGACSRTTTVACDLGTLAPGGSATVVIAALGSGSSGALGAGERGDRCHRGEGRVVAARCLAPFLVLVFYAAGVLLVIFG